MNGKGKQRLLYLAAQRLALRPADLQAFKADLDAEAAELFGAGLTRHTRDLSVMSAALAEALGNPGANDRELLAIIDAWAKGRERVEPLLPPAAGQPITPAVTQPSERGKRAEPPWQEEARKEARRIYAKSAKGGVYYSLESLGDQVAAHWRKLGINGPNGQPLCGAYIKRHALQGHGITQQAGKLRSTPIKRGK
jgi:hypothetical protein